MTDLLDTPTAEQRLLIETVAAVFIEHRRWPIVDYVQRRLDEHDVDAMTLAASLPRLGVAGGGYSAIWSRVGWNEREEIGLTLLGIYHSQLFRAEEPPLETGIFAAIDYFVTARRTTAPDPFDVTEVQVNGDEAMRAAARVGVSPDRLPSDALYKLLENEPATWYGGHGQPTAGDWYWHVPRHVLKFADAHDVPTYVERIRSTVLAPPPEVRAVVSPLELVAAFDYFDAVWRLIPGHSRLLRLQGAERTAKLALDAASADEYGARLSALAEVLTTLDVPQPRGKVPKTRDRDPTLIKLRAYLIELLPAASHPRIEQEIERLQAVIDLRHGAHHGEARTRAAAAYAALSIQPGDWYETWRHVQAITVEALEGLREEIAPLTR